MRFYKKLIAGAFAFILYNFCAAAGVCAEMGYSASEKDKIFKKIIPTHTMGTITEDCVLRKEASVLSEAAAKLRAGAVVEVLQDYSEKWYRVENADADAVGWLPSKYLLIDETQIEKPEALTKEEAEAFVNLMDFPSKTGLFVWTDIARQKTYVFKKTGRYSLIKSFECSTGKPATPTARGFFHVNGRGEWFYSKRLKSGGMYWVRFNKTYLFHSLAMDKNRNITDSVLGERRSSGCVRLNVADAEWIYENIPDGTSVFIH